MMFLFKKKQHINKNYIHNLEDKKKYLKLLLHEDGYEVSNKAKELHENKEEVAQILYGETIIDNIEKIFFNDFIIQYMKNKKHFCDLGSGTGNVVLSLALIDYFETYSGIEYLKYLHDFSNKKKEIFIKDFSKFKERVNFYNADILKVNLSKYDVLFINYPFSDDKKKKQLEDKLEKELKKDSIVIYGIATLDSKKFRFINNVTLKFSWGDGSCYFYVKK